MTPSQPSVKGQFDDVAKFLAAFANAFTAPWIRPDIPIGLTITTSTNATASTSETLRFLQRSPEEPRTGCPADLGESTSQSFEPAIGGRGGKVMKKAVVTSVSCSNPTGCSGAVAMTVGSQTISGLNPGKTARAAKQGLVVIGAGDFSTDQVGEIAVSVKPNKARPAPAREGAADKGTNDRVHARAHGRGRTPRPEHPPEAVIRRVHTVIGRAHADGTLSRSAATPATRAPAPALLPRDLRRSFARTRSARSDPQCR